MKLIDNIISDIDGNINRHNIKNNNLYDITAKLIEDQESVFKLIYEWDYFTIFLNRISNIRSILFQTIQKAIYCRIC